MDKLQVETTKVAGMKNRPIGAPSQEMHLTVVSANGNSSATFKAVSSSSTPQKRPAPSEELSAQGSSKSQNVPPSSTPNKRRVTPPSISPVSSLHSPTSKGPSFPPLETFDEIERKREVYVGPTTESNWVILDRLLVGAYPGVNDDDDNMSLLWSILTQKITTFCCLQVEYPDPSVTEEMWRSGKAIRPYYKDAVDIVSHVDQMRAVAEPGHVAQYSNVTTSSKLDFVHVPIVDCSVTDDTTIIKLCKDLVARLAKGEILYLHCWGGHGRTGTAICIMLHLMYDITSFEALRYCQYVHDLRRIPINVGSPQTQMQRDQVIRVIRFLAKEKQREREQSLQRAKARAAKRAAAAAAQNQQLATANQPESSPSLAIQNGNNVIAGSAPPILNRKINSNSNSNNSGNSNNNNNSKSVTAMRRSNAAGKKSLREMREANREKQQRSNAKTTTTAAGTSKETDDNTMIIAGLHIGNEGNAGGKPTITIPTVPTTSSTALPSVNPVPAKADAAPTAASSKVDEIMDASPVKAIKPQPPSNGSSKKAKGPRAGKAVKA